MSDPKFSKTSPLVSEPIQMVGGRRDLMNFPDAMKAIINGDRITRLEWDNIETVVELREGTLVIFDIADNLWHPLIITDGDLLGEDWVIVPVN